MFSKNLTCKSTKNYSEQIRELRDLLCSSDIIVVGAGAGLSASAGLLYGGERFERYFSKFIQKYNLKDMYSAAFYPYPTQEELWAYWSKHIYHNRYAQELNDTYPNLLRLLKGKDYFVITTNADHLFQKNGFDKQRLFYTQGDYGLFQCSVPCHEKTYDNEEVIMEMVAQQKDLKIPSELIPHCPRCKEVMTQNLRKDDAFVEDEGWHQALSRYEQFLKTREDEKIVYWELGIGANTPVIIKYPFWHFVQKNPKASYVCLNLNDAFAPKEIEAQSLLIEHDIGDVLRDLLQLQNAL